VNDHGFQLRVGDWLKSCFSEKIRKDPRERCRRFAEESLELVQSLGLTSDDAHKLVDYVYGRPTGEPSQEVGGVLITLAALCSAFEIEMELAGEYELHRVWENIDKIREKQLAKSKVEIGL
jgi:hypothetical protein